MAFFAMTSGLGLWPVACLVLVVGVALALGRSRHEAVDPSAPLCGRPEWTMTRALRRGAAYARRSLFFPSPGADVRSGLESFETGAPLAILEDRAKCSVARRPSFARAATRRRRTRP